MAAMPRGKAGDDPGPERAKALDGFGRYAGPATLILASLADGAKHGYALTKDIESFAGVRLAPGTLYEARARTADVLRHQTRLAVAACAAMAVFLAAGGAWIADRTPRPGSLFHPGAIDVAGLAVMTLALAVGQ